ncbi:hypothetical protein H9656_01035 [Brevundimonas sp. Sa3CVA3]|uniref:Uncharacterized protein n=1 Tax=Brevundimonas guildfordensis TaxID=2762241 RepID=A0ABR8QWS7_9CAUL|nr:hypothetical protein [Brevundimonas guildfordensis]
MGRLLDILLEASPAYQVRRDNGGFLLVGNPKRAAEFNDVVRQANDDAGADFVAFPISDDRNGYSQMFIIPLA